MKKPLVRTFVNLTAESAKEAGAATRGTVRNRGMMPVHALAGWSPE